MPYSSAITEEDVAAENAIDIAHRAAKKKYGYGTDEYYQEFERLMRQLDPGYIDSDTSIEMEGMTPDSHRALGKVTRALGGTIGTVVPPLAKAGGMALGALAKGNRPPAPQVESVQGASPPLGDVVHGVWQPELPEWIQGLIGQEETPLLEAIAAIAGGDPEGMIGKSAPMPNPQPLPQEPQIPMGPQIPMMEQNIPIPPEIRAQSQAQGPLSLLDALPLPQANLDTGAGDYAPAGEYIPPPPVDRSRQDAYEAATASAPMRGKPHWATLVLASLAGFGTQNPQLAQGLIDSDYNKKLQNWERDLGLKRDLATTERSENRQTLEGYRSDRREYRAGQREDRRDARADRQLKSQDRYYQGLNRNQRLGITARAESSALDRQNRLDIANIHAGARRTPVPELPGGKESMENWKASATRLAKFTSTFFKEMGVSEKEAELLRPYVDDVTEILDDGSVRQLAASEASIDSMIYGIPQRVWDRLTELIAGRAARFGGPAFLIEEIE